MTTESGLLVDTQYSFSRQFAEGRGTNPDDLIAASLEGCFSMPLSNELGLSGYHPRRIETTATAHVRDSVPDVSQALYEAALAAKTKCHVARLLNTNISMTATLNP